MSDSVHKPVLLNQVVEGLTSGFKPEGAAMPWYLDGTLGGAGHAQAIAKTLGGNLGIIAFDRDPEAVKRGAELLEGKCEKLIIENADYRQMESILGGHGIQSIDLVLLDLGLSSDELEKSGKGFSFQRDEPLLMTMGDESKYDYTASTIVNNWDEENIATIIYGYGEDRFSRRIARAIVSYRARKPITTSAELAEIIKLSVPPPFRRGKIHPATKTFQALRIAVNDELGALREGLAAAYKMLAPNGRIAVISFHSLEDRIVKDFFKSITLKGEAEASKKPIIAEELETAENPRARSAKLRILKKIQTF